MSNDPYSSPLAFYGSELKRVRERARLTQAEVTERIPGYSVSTVSAYEQGTRIPSAHFSEHADKLFGTEGDLTRLQKLVESVSVRPWFRDRIEVERKAAEIREYDSYQVPGLLQTEDYARAIMSATRPVLPEETVERAVALRMTRQQILEPDDDLPADREHTPRFWAVIDEGALYRLSGSQEAMHGQFLHLAEMMKRPAVTIQVVPNRRGPTAAFGRAFALLVSHNNSSVVYLEDLGTARYIRDRDEVSRYTTVFDHLRASALDDEQSFRLIEKLIEGGTK